MRPLVEVAVITALLHCVAGGTRYFIQGDAAQFDVANSSCWSQGGWIPSASNPDDSISLVEFLKQANLTRSWLDKKRVHVAWHLPVQAQTDVLIYDKGCIPEDELLSPHTPNVTFTSFVECAQYCSVYDYTYTALKAKSPAECVCADGFTVKNERADEDCDSWCLWFPACGSTSNVRVLSQSALPYGDCVTIDHNGMWWPSDCQQDLPYVCQQEFETTTQEETTIPSSTEVPGTEIPSTSPPSTTSSTPEPDSDSQTTVIAIIAGVVGGMLLLLLIFCCTAHCCRRKGSRYEMPTPSDRAYSISGDQVAFERVMKQASTM